MSKVKIEVPFVPRPVEMLKSSAYRALGKHAHRILELLEIEHIAHRGKDNGRLHLPYAQMVQAGVGRRFVKPALLELEALGLTEAKWGRGGNGEFRTPNLFRLTYFAADDQPSTNEWKQITSIEEARTVRSQARAGGQKRRTRLRARPVNIRVASA